MNSSEVKGGWGQGDVSGSVQLMFELPAINDSIVMTNLSYKANGVHAINNYGGIDAKREYLTGNVKLVRDGDKMVLTAFIDLVTQNPDTRQQIVLANHSMQSFSCEEYQHYMNQKDSIQKKENDELVNAITQAVIARDSILEAGNKRIQDSLKLHPYTGPFRFWVSKVDKPEYLRTTYSVNQDSIVVKKGPYDFIYLAKNYPADAVYFKRALTKKEKKALAALEQQAGLDSLERFYSNNCILDGLILVFDMASAAFSKEVSVTNYYQESLGAVVRFLNDIVPKPYRIWYDKKQLVKDQNACGR
ncbi:hypothetical protein [Paraflavitalea pollutisoli]|uniref:hypothetical protein n=1 Tax=Paraflavitalea pollutisoli TaxID=3034143 RepID=UPI0023EE1326|nr:hypothetical protein [Paraflavitalea sp. H1-2-19X]